MAALSVSFGALSAPTLADDSFSSKVDALMKEAIPATGPGCSIGVIKDGAFLHKAGYGLANMEHNIPLSPDTVFRMASVSKQFTAMAVQLVAEEGLIDLDEDIRTYMPALTDYGKKVSIRSMLGHTSGMGDYDMVAGSYEGPKVDGAMELKSSAGGEFRLGNEDYLTIKEFYDVVKRVPLHHEPDTEYRYSNLAYFLLSMLVEEVSGKTLRQYSDEKIFKPLNMDKTLFSDDGNEILKNRASGYKAKKDGSGYILDMTNLFWVGDGGLHTSVNEMLKWDNNFYNPKVGKNPKDFMKVMNTPNSQISTSSGLYANGQTLGEKNGVKYASHSGGWLGTSTYYSRLPEHRFSVVALCNEDGHGPGKYVTQIIDLYLAGKK